MARSIMIGLLGLASVFTSSCESNYRIAVKDEVERHFRGRETLSFGAHTNFTIGTERLECIEVAIREPNRRDRVGAAILLNKGDYFVFRQFIPGQSCKPVRA